MRICVFFECSERIKKAFLDAGHDAHSCDLKPGELGLPNHHQCDFRELLYEPWDMGIFNPDCTYLANSGVRWLIDNPERHHKMLEACKVFNLCLDAPIPLVVVENPIQHKYARQFIRPPDQIIHPYHFGDMESKATCLWLKGLPPLIAKFSGGEGIKQSVWREPPSPNRRANRARTFQGIAKAMAEQWGSIGMGAVI